MKIILNNRAEEINEENMSVLDLIQYKNFSFKMLVTKVNDQLVKKEDRKNVYIKDGDDVVVLHLISGG